MDQGLAILDRGLRPRLRPPFLYEVNEMKDLLKLPDLSRERSSASWTWLTR